MPMTLATASGSRPLDPVRSYRAYADVVMLHPAGGAASPTIQCLVDTGADYTILPLGLAAAVGIVPTGPLVAFRTAAGTLFALPSHPSVNLTVEGYAITVPVAFSAAPAFAPLLGRLELVAAFDAGFDVTSWYWD